MAKMKKKVRHTKPSKARVKAEALKIATRGSTPMQAALVGAGRTFLGGGKPEDRAALGALAKKHPVATLAGELAPAAAVPSGILGGGIARAGMAASKFGFSRALRGRTRDPVSGKPEPKYMSKEWRQREIGRITQKKKAAAAKKAGTLPKGVSTKDPRKLGEVVSEAYVQGGAAPFQALTNQAEILRAHGRKKKKKKLKNLGMSHT